MKIAVLDYECEDVIVKDVPKENLKNLMEMTSVLKWDTKVVMYAI